MIVFQPPSEPLNIVLIQLCLSSSQTISASPVPLFELSSPTDSTPQPQKAYESTPTVPPTPSKIDLAPEAIAAALLMMARTSSYVPREFLLLSFSLAFTDSSQEETQTQEGEGQPKPQSIGGYGWLTFDCAVYVMKWFEIIQPQNVKKEKYEWDNRTQAEMDHFRVEFASWILFHEMNRDRNTAIRRSKAMRLSNPSAVLLSSYCQVDSYDIDSDSD
ncbi:hypothetical protein AHAS_Ahas14G0165400 [Arachis hypogaea]